jgi:asparagine synthase (glutamine-hydrolysing)
MCGIAGLWDPAERAPGMALDRMLSSILHRGPDGEGRHVEPDRGLALGMRRLSIIDLAGGGQPIWNEDRTVGVVFNGEIYNYLELRAELVARGHRMATDADTEVLVHLYEDHGRKLVDRLRGMFAFCILDLKRGELFIARDHFGQKPLYYCKAGDRFAFASELKALLLLPWVPREIDEAAFLDYVAWEALPPPRTHFTAIRKLSPGSSLVLSLRSGEVTGERYWRYDLTGAAPLADLDEAAEELGRVFGDSVGLHLRADVPVGVLLSSGLDSRAVLAYARPRHPGELHSFSVGFAGFDDELPGAAATARDFGSIHHQIELTPADLADSIDRVAWLLDEPVGDPACFAVLRLCTFAREHVKVLLSGEGSDELLAGYANRYASMQRAMSRTRGLRLLAPLVPRSRAFRRRTAWERALAGAASTPGGELAWLRVAGPKGLAPEWDEAIGARAEATGKGLYRRQRDDLSTALLFDIEWNLPEFLLQKADKMSMGASIELRTPFLDVDVAALAGRMASSLKLPQAGPGKYVLRRLLSGRDQASMQRPKKGFPVPLHLWLGGPLRQEVEGSLFGDRSPLAGLLDASRLRAAWQAFRSGAWNEGGTFFYSLWLYERWRGALPSWRATAAGAGP